MFKKLCIFAVMMLFSFLILSCSLVYKPNNGGNSSNTGVNDNQNQYDPHSTIEPSKPTPSIKPIDSIKQQISRMSLDDKIGQMLIAGIQGYEIDNNTKQLEEKYKVGGFIVLGENVKSTPQLLKLINSIKEKNINSKIPLFISVDEEGGSITRMPKEFTKLPTNKVIGNLNNEKFSYEIGKNIADEIKAFGFNMDFAPVMDVNTNPKNPIIGDRSFGNNAALVSRLGVKTMQGLQSQNIISVVKHFPGHGDTSVDSHLGLPTVNNDLDRLQKIELQPFEASISNNTDAVMIAHILLPKIDKENPASMSKVLISDILRTNLKFNGVVITDDMTMGAILKNYKIGEAAVKSVNAGADIVLVCHGYDNIISVYEALKSAVIKGNIPEERIDQSVYSILKLKAKYNINDETKSTVNVEAINKSLNTLLKNYIK